MRFRSRERVACVATKPSLRRRAMRVSWLSTAPRAMMRLMAVSRSIFVPLRRRPYGIFIHSYWIHIHNDRDCVKWGRGDFPGGPATSARGRRNWRTAGRVKICVFCSSSDAVGPAYFAAATEMGSADRRGRSHARLRRRQGRDDGRRGPGRSRQRRPGHRHHTRLHASQGRGLRKV